jgi:hypothetical protein
LKTEGGEKAGVVVSTAIYKGGVEQDMVVWEMDDVTCEVTVKVYKQKMFNKQNRSQDQHNTTDPSLRYHADWN